MSKYTIDASVFLLLCKKHLKYINSQISRPLFAMKQSKVFLPKESLRTLYGILAWGNAKHDILNKTHLLQKRALRAIRNKNTLVTPIRFSNSQWY